MSYNFVKREDLCFKRLFTYARCVSTSEPFSRYFRIFPFWRNQQNVPGEITIEITEKNLLPGENLKSSKPFFKSKKINCYFVVLQNLLLAKNLELGMVHSF